MPMIYLHLREGERYDAPLAIPPEVRGPYRHVGIWGDQLSADGQPIATIVQLRTVGGHLTSFFRPLDRPGVEFGILEIRTEK